MHASSNIYDDLHALCSHNRLLAHGVVAKLELRCNNRGIVEKLNDDKDYW